jgi:hypothetical protein
MAENNNVVAMDNAALMAEIARLKAENASLVAKPAGKLTLKVSAKGGLSVYGLGRWPVTLYVGQWMRLLAIVEEIKTFIAAHKGELKEKGEAAPAEQ